MNIREISKPVTAKGLNESLAKKFGQRINLEAFTIDQLQTARNNLRTKLSQVETTESFNSTSTAEYQKSKLFLDVLNAELSEREHVDVAIEESVIVEGEEDKAELVMAAKDMVDRVTGWMEDTAEMQTESMLELADAIRDEMGSEQSESFVNTVKPALEAMYATMETTRETLTQGVGMLTGEAEPVDAMGAEDPAMEPTVDGEMDMDMEAPAEEPMDDEFATDAAAAGGEEEAGREKRESVERSKKKGLNETLDNAGIVLQILKTIKPGSQVSWDTMNEYMEKAGIPQFNYESFKTIYDSTAQLQKLVKFDPDGITINDSAMDQVASPATDAPDTTVTDMAKRATDLSDL
jgi:hypothetical protein